MQAKDSLQNARALNELKNIKDTLQSEDNTTEAEIKTDKNKESKLPKDTQNKKAIKTDMILPEKQKEPVVNKKDTAIR